MHFEDRLRDIILHPGAMHGLSCRLKHNASTLQIGLGYSVAVASGKLN